MPDAHQSPKKKGVKIATYINALRKWAVTAPEQAILKHWRFSTYIERVWPYVINKNTPVRDRKLSVYDGNLGAGAE